jgi:tryptophan synthase alpha subunit
MACWWSITRQKPPMGWPRNCAHCGLDLIFLLASTSTERRIRQMAERASGYLYCVSVKGVTGTSTLDDQVRHGRAFAAMCAFPWASGSASATRRHGRDIAQRPMPS